MLSEVWRYGWRPLDGSVSTLLARDIVGYWDRRRLRLSAQFERAARRELERAWRFFSAHDIRTVLDVGVNVGRFVEEIRRFLHNARIFSFEPLPSVFAELEHNLSEDDNAFAVGIALSDQNGVATVQESAFTPSSSLLEMTKAHRENWFLPTSCGFTLVRPEHEM